MLTDKTFPQKIVLLSVSVMVGVWVKLGCYLGLPSLYDHLISIPENHDKRPVTIHVSVDIVRSALCVANGASILHE